MGDSCWEPSHASPRKAGYGLHRHEPVHSIRCLALILCLFFPDFLRFSPIQQVCIISPHTRTFIVIDTPIQTIIDTCMQFSYMFSCFRCNRQVSSCRNLWARIRCFLGWCTRRSHCVPARHCNSAKIFWQPMGPGPSWNHSWGR